MGIWPVIALVLLSADWDNLKEVTRDTTYAVALRNGRCIKGTLGAWNDRQVVIKSQVAKRADVVRVLDVGPYIVSAVPVYSGRSSWADVKASGARDLLITTKSGDQVRWESPEILDDRITFHEKSLAKVDVATVSCLRFRPLTRREEYVHHESVDVLAPRLWFNGWLLGKIKVKLFDVSMAEDNSILGCW
jgi:hypothetical protein